MLAAQALQRCQMLASVSVAAPIHWEASGITMTSQCARFSHSWSKLASRSSPTTYSATIRWRWKIEPSVSCHLSSSIARSSHWSSKLRQTCLVCSDSAQLKCSCTINCKRTSTACQFVQRSLLQIQITSSPASSKSSSSMKSKSFASPWTWVSQATHWRAMQCATSMTSSMLRRALLDQLCQRFHRRGTRFSLWPSSLSLATFWLGIVHLTGRSTTSQRLTKLKIWSSARFRMKSSSGTQNLLGAYRCTIEWRLTFCKTIW